MLADGFENENIKINAIKYLFFKQKPGGYILSMFQEEITNLNDDYDNQVEINIEGKGE